VTVIGARRTFITCMQDPHAVAVTQWRTRARRSGRQCDGYSRLLSLTYSYYCQTRHVWVGNQPFVLACLRLPLVSTRHIPGLWCRAGGGRRSRPPTDSRRRHVRRGVVWSCSLASVTPASISHSADFSVIGRRSVGERRSTGWLVAAVWHVAFLSCQSQYALALHPSVECLFLSVSVSPSSSVGVRVLGTLRQQPCGLPKMPCRLTSCRSSDQSHVCSMLLPPRKWSEELMVMSRMTRSVYAMFIDG